MEKYIEHQENKDLLRFLTCGSVDDGKSTLIGRLLYDSKMIFEDQLKEVENESKKYGTTGKDLDMALLVDGLQSEREQGITIDVAYRFFTTDKRKFIIADTPGHEQYTRNMVTGASTSDVAVILIDARKGILTQTRRHSFIVSLLGIKKIIVAVNKMDLVDFSQDIYEKIVQDYEKLAKELEIKESFFVPISALKGDNIVKKSPNTPWYAGKVFLELLNTIEISDKIDSADFRFPIQYVNRPNLNFRGYCGTIAGGSVKVGDDITILPSGKTTKIKEIINAGDVKEGGFTSKIDDTNSIYYTPMAVTITTEDELDISRGDMIVHTKALPRVSNTLKVMIVWMDETPMIVGKTYDFKRATTLLSGHIEKINYKIDVNTFKREKVDKLNLNDISSCRVVLSQPIAADIYKENRQTGSFIIIDRVTNHTVGAGMIVNVAARDGDDIVNMHRTYTEAEKALNSYIRNHFPEWGCKEIK